MSGSIPANPPRGTTVTIGKLAGVFVSLSAIKRCLERGGAIGIGQRSFARRHNVDQGNLSKVLRGKLNGKYRKDATYGWHLIVPPRIEQALLDEFSRHGLAADAFAAALPSQGAGSTTPDAADVPEPEPKEEEPEPDSYPIGKMQKVARICRDGAKGGEVSMTFSPRALIRIGIAYTIFKLDAGISHWPALSAAFWVTKVYAADDEARIFMLEAYQRVFAREATPPEKLLPHRPDQHPGEVLVKLLASRGYAVWSFGGTGEGKTYANKRVAVELSRTGRYHRFQGERDKTASDFVGDIGANSGTTHRVDGPLPTAREAGEPLIVDEVCVCDPSVLMCLQAVLEGDDLYITGSYHKVVEAEIGHLILVTDNTRGLGESIEYVGTHAINESTRDRFYFVEFGSMDPEQERGIVRSELELPLPDKIA
jgi:hypothetical protein